MRVLVCGGRDFKDKDFVYSYLSAYHSTVNPIDVVIEGDAKGPNRMAGYWARKNRVSNLKFKADWNKFGKAAGPIRNTKMLKEGKPDLVIAFPGNEGTANMIEQSQKAGIPVLIPVYEGAGNG